MQIENVLYLECDFFELMSHFRTSSRSIQLHPDFSIFIVSNFMSNLILLVLIFVVVSGSRGNGEKYDGGCTKTNGCCACECNSGFKSDGLTCDDVNECVVQIHVIQIRCSLLLL